MLKEHIEDLINDNNILPSITLEITNRCNFKCVHCYLGNRNNEELNRFHDELSLQEITAILLQAKEMKVIRIVVTGGEPLLHKDIKEILKQIKSMGFMLYLMTNASLINEDNVSVIRDNVDVVYTTRYAATASTYIEVTKNLEAFNNYERAISLLKDNNVSVVERAILLRENEKEYDKLEKICQGGLETYICGKNSDDYVTIHRPSSEVLKKHYFALKNAPDKKHDTNQSVCGVGKTSLTINAKGQIIPCTNFNLILGDINNETLYNVWNSKKLENLRALAKTPNFEQCWKCNNFENSYFLCMANNYEETGNVTSVSDEVCRHCKIIGEVKKSV